MPRLALFGAQEEESELEELMLVVPESEGSDSEGDEGGAGPRLLQPRRDIPQPNHQLTGTMEEQQKTNNLDTLRKGKAPS